MVIEMAGMADLHSGRPVTCFREPQRAEKTSSIFPPLMEVDQNFRLLCVLVYHLILMEN